MLDQTYSSSFEVEQIVDEKIIDGQTHYLVKWIGYGHQENTWEPLRHMSNSKDKIRDWENYKIKQLRLASNNYGLQSLQLMVERNKYARRDSEIFKETHKNASNPYKKVFPKLSSLDIKQGEDEKEAKTQIYRIFDQPEMKKLIKTRKSDRKKKELQMFQKRLKTRPKVWEQYLQNQDEVIKKANEKIKEVIDKVYGSQNDLFTEQQKILMQSKLKQANNEPNSDLKNLKKIQKLSFPEDRKIKKANLKDRYEEKEKNFISEEEQNKNLVSKQQPSKIKTDTIESLKRNEKIRSKEQLQIQRYSLKKRNNIFLSSSQDESLPNHKVRNKSKSNSNNKLLLTQEILSSKVELEKFNNNDSSLEQQTNFVSQKQTKNIESNKTNVLVNLLKEMVSENRKKQSLQKNFVKESSLELNIQPETVRLSLSMITKMKEKNAKQICTNEFYQQSLESNKSSQRLQSSNRIEIKFESCNAELKSDVISKIQSQFNCNFAEIKPDQKQKFNSINHYPSFQKNNGKTISQKNSSFQNNLCEDQQQESVSSCGVQKEKSMPQIDEHKTDKQLSKNNHYKPLKIEEQIHETEQKQNNIHSEENQKPHQANKLESEQVTSRLQLKKSEPSLENERFIKDNQQKPRKIKLQALEHFNNKSSNFSQKRKFQQQNERQSVQSSQKRNHIKTVAFYSSDEVKSDILSQNHSKKSLEKQIVNKNYSQKKYESEELDGKNKDFQPPFDCSISTIEEISMINLIKSEYNLEQNLKIQFSFSKNKTQNIKSSVPFPIHNFPSDFQEKGSNQQSQSERDDEQQDEMIQSHQQIFFNNPSRVVNYSSLTNHLSTALPEQSIHSQNNNRNMDPIIELIRHQSLSTRASWHTIRTANNPQSLSPTQYTLPSQEITQIEQEGKSMIQVPVEKQNHQDKSDILGLQELLEKVHNSSLQLQNPSSKEIKYTPIPNNLVNLLNFRHLFNIKNVQTNQNSASQQNSLIDLLKQYDSQKVQVAAKTQTQKDLHFVIDHQKMLEIIWSKLKDKSRAERQVRAQKGKQDNYAEEYLKSQEESNGELLDQAQEEEGIDHRKFILRNDLQQALEESQESS